MIDNELREEIEFIIKDHGMDILVEEFEAEHLQFDWTDICITYDLSEAFLRRFKHKVDWQMVSAYQKMSPMFIHKHKDCLNINILINRGVVTKEELEKAGRIRISRFELIDLD